MLERLQGQAQSFDSIANRGSEAINNFDLQEQMYSGAELAYRMGHEQLNALVGGEVVQEHPLNPQIRPLNHPLLQVMGKQPQMTLLVMTVVPLEHRQIP